MSESKISPSDRAAGAIVGSLIGEALGVGPHWYYDVDEMHRVFGGRITDYVESQPGHYHHGLKKGEYSQAGRITRMLMDSVLASKGYDEKDFLRRFDEFLDTLDGTKQSGFYTEQTIRDVWHARKVEKKEWGEDGVAGYADTSEACFRNVVLGALFANDIYKAGSVGMKHAAITHAAPTLQIMSASFSTIIAAIIRGVPFDENMGKAFGDMMRKREIPFTFVVGASKDQPKETLDTPAPDTLFWPGFIIRAANDPELQIPLDKAAKMYGMACSTWFLLPAAYYLSARCSTDFEAGVFAAINGGGNNMARAQLTGALIGAQVGLSGIPQRLIDGLVDGAEVVEKAREIARMGTEGLE